MITTVIAIGAAAALFAVYGLVGGRGCDGHCPGCGTGCELRKEDPRVR